MKFVVWNGWAMRPGAFAPLIRELADAEITVPCLQAQRGDSLVEWAARLVPEVPADAVLMGWSLGAMLALAAVAQGARPRALVLIGATARFVATDDWPHGLPPETVDSFERGFATAPMRTLRRFLALQGVGDSSQQGVVAALGKEIAIDEPSLAVGLRALCRADLRAICAKIAAVPTLLIHGEGDSLMPIAASRWLADVVATKEHMIYPARGHAPHVSDPASVATAIRNFVGRLPDAV